MKLNQNKSAYLRLLLLPLACLIIFTIGMIFEDTVSKTDLAIGRVSYFQQDLTSIVAILFSIAAVWMFIKNRGIRRLTFAWIVANTLLLVYVLILAGIMMVPD